MRERYKVAVRVRESVEDCNGLASRVLGRGVVGGAGRGLTCAHDDVSSSLLRSHVTLVAPPE